MSLQLLPGPSKVRYALAMPCGVLPWSRLVRTACQGCFAIVCTLLACTMFGLTVLHFYLLMPCRIRMLPLRSSCLLCLEVMQKGHRLSLKSILMLNICFEMHHQHHQLLVWFLFLDVKICHTWHVSKLLTISTNVADTLQLNSGRQGDAWWTYRAAAPSISSSNNKSSKWKLA